MEWNAFQESKVQLSFVVVEIKEEAESLWMNILCLKRRAVSFDGE
jgi:hypothetical protein